MNPVMEAALAAAAATQKPGRTKQTARKATGNMGFSAATMARGFTRVDGVGMVAQIDLDDGWTPVESFLFLALEQGRDEIVEDNASPHNNDAIRASHTANNVRIVGYTVTAAEKEEIKALIREQCEGYRRDQDKKAQMTKQTHELDRLPVWPPNSPDLNLIEVVWSWMVRWIVNGEGAGRPTRNS